MQVEVVRRGGLAGVQLKAAIDTRELPPGPARQAEAALRELPYGRPVAPTRHPDGFQYEFTLLDEQPNRSVVLDEAEVPHSLRPVVETAVARGDIV
jgi:hypothetical protein